MSAASERLPLPGEQRVISGSPQTVTTEANEWLAKGWRVLPKSIRLQDGGHPWALLVIEKRDG